MGYDVDRFASEINGGLLCCICRDVLQDPLQAPCEHAFCRSCINSWLVTECSCPEDRNPLLTSDLRPLFRYMRNDLNRLRIHCVNKNLGCDHVCNLEHLAVHEELCPLAIIPCPNISCPATMARREVDNHLKECEHGTKECPKGCGLLLQTAEDREHNCLVELRTTIELLRTEMICKLDDQKKEMELRLDMQRGHMIQREAAMQAHISDLKTEVTRLSQKIKLLMDLELQRRQELERMQTERKEILQFLQDIQNEQPNGTNGCRFCSRNSKVTTI